MTTGQAGLALQQQRTQNLQGALGQQQSYLGSGLGLGDTAMGLYQQGLQNRSNAQQSALGYLGSGQTQYQAGASYLDRAEAASDNAAQGGPVYQPDSLGQSYTGTAQQASEYGLQVGNQATNWFNSLNAAGYGGAAIKNRGAAALSGAASGALSGAATGAAVSGPYAPVGAVVGGLAGGALGGGAGYFS